MSRNDIRLRRKMMTSRRMESHKDYRGLMNQYKRGSLARKILKWTAVILFIMVIIYLAIFLS